MRTIAFFCLLLLPACGKEEPAPRVEHPSAAASESALAKSRLPNANAVGRAMSIADSAAARRAREDSIAREVP